MVFVNNNGYMQKKCFWKYYKNFLRLISCLGTLILIMDIVESNHLSRFILLILISDHIQTGRQNKALSTYKTHLT